MAFEGYYLSGVLDCIDLYSTWMIIRLMLKKNTKQDRLMAASAACLRATDKADKKSAPVLALGPRATTSARALCQITTSQHDPIVPYAPTSCLQSSHAGPDRTVVI